jgi:hypothetical protein
MTRNIVRAVTCRLSEPFRVARKGREKAGRLRNFAQRVLVIGLLIATITGSWPASGTAARVSGAASCCRAKSSCGMVCHLQHNGGSSLSRCGSGHASALPSLPAPVVLSTAVSVRPSLTHGTVDSPRLTAESNPVLDHETPPPKRVA